MTDQQIWRLFTGGYQGCTQFRCDPVTGSWHRSTIAIAVAGSVIGTDASESRDVRLQPLPCIERVGEPGLQHYSGAPFSSTVEVDPKSAGTYEAAWATNPLSVRAPRNGLVRRTSKGDERQQPCGRQCDPEPPRLPNPNSPSSTMSDGPAATIFALQQASRPGVRRYLTPRPLQSKHFNSTANALTVRGWAPRMGSIAVPLLRQPYSPLPCTKVSRISGGSAAGQCSILHVRR